MRQAVAETEQFARLHRPPVLVGGQRLGDDHRHAVVRRGRRRQIVQEQPTALAFKKRDAPAVAVMIGAAAATGKPLEGKSNVSRHNAVHAE